MSGELSEKEALDCKTVSSNAEVNNLPNQFKSQLLFSDVSYAQGGKYICVATQNDVVRTVCSLHPSEYISFFRKLLSGELKTLWQLFGHSLDLLSR